jgi:hypothetical protein
MVTVLPNFPDIELVCMDLLADLGNTVTATGAEVPSGTILIERIGGPDDGITDRPRVQITAYGSARQGAWALIENCRQRILRSGGTLVYGEHTNGVLIDLARTATPPRQLPEFGRGARIVQGVFEFHLRRQWAAQ